jgi:folate-dependent phosphoribosylglycinamide formyltransferase PurN
MLNEFTTTRVAILCSKRAPGIDQLLHHPQRNRLFEIACVVSTERHFADHDRLEAAGVPVLLHPIESWKQLDVRREYDAITAEMLKALQVDAVVLLGYLYVLTDGMLAAFPDRILNVHDSDLTLLDVEGKRRYTGLHSTRDAIIHGEKETRSSVHVVTSQLDGGPLLFVSDPYPVSPMIEDAIRWGALDIVRAYAYAQREWMMRDCWGEMAAHMLEYFAFPQEITA